MIYNMGHVLKSRECGKGGKGETSGVSDKNMTRTEIASYISFIDNRQWNMVIKSL